MTKRELVDLEAKYWKIGHAEGYKEGRDDYSSGV